MGLALFLLGLPAVALGILAAAWFVFLPAGPGTETFVEIAPGSSAAAMGAALQQAGVIRNRWAFVLVRAMERGRLKAGEYRFVEPASVPDVYARIARGDVYTRQVTIPEGANRFDIATRLAAAGLGTRDGFLAATVSETGLIRDLDPAATTVEGYLFPDTYRFQRRATEQQMITAMVKRFREKAATIGLITNARAEAQAETHAEDLHRLVTLASLVERETAVASERPLVASVLTNRLDKKMPLMTDPAVIYGLETDGRWRGAIYASDLKFDTPYNTYRHAGLPPGPIANPGLDSLRAALHPAVSDYLYFVAASADPQGHSRFAATLNEHAKNVASYRVAVKKAGAR